MDNATHIGLDVHKDAIAFAVLRPGVTDCDEWVIPNTPEAVRKLLARHPDHRCCGHATRRSGTHRCTSDLKSRRRSQLLRLILVAAREIEDVLDCRDAPEVVDSLHLELQVEGLAILTRRLDRH